MLKQACSLHRVVLPLLATGAIAGCGSMPAKPSASPAATAPEAARAYIAAADQEAAATAAAQDLCPAPAPTADQIRRCATAFAAADRAFVGALQRIAFPATAAHHVSALIAAKTDEATADDALVRSADPDEDHDIDTDLDDALARDDIATREVDADLGIPILGDNPPRSGID